MKTYRRTITVTRYALGLLLAALPAAAEPPASAEPLAPRSGSAAGNDGATAGWMARAGFGLMIHQFVFNVDNLTPDEYDARVEKFDAERFAEQVAQTGAGYVILTIGQNSGYYCAPSAVYDRLIGGEPGRKTSRRDLPMELGKALKRRGIRMLLYLPSRSPQRDKEAMAALGDVDQRQPAPQKFIRNWSEVCREWSLRYGKLASGWWFDGYYVPEGWDVPGARYTWRTWAEAVRAGNPQAEFAFNRGSRAHKAFLKMNGAQTFTAGEMPNLDATPETHPAADGLQWHLLTYLGRKWGYWSKKPRYDTATLLRFIDTINAQGGCLTLDVRATDEGQIQPVLFETLRPLGQHRKALTNGRLDPALQGAK